MLKKLPTDYQTYIAVSRYARWLDGENRRETWEETVDRYLVFMGSRTGLSLNVLKELRAAILNLEVMPSMRALMTAGPALERDHVAGYNCAYVEVNRLRAFDEAMYILMCGTGVGFSVERQHVQRLPEISEVLDETDTVIQVRDSKNGWASAYRELLSMLYAGRVPKWDLSRLRPAGARLKTFGGRSSGPEPLDDLFRFTVEVFKNAAGRKLTSLECHDLMCKIGDTIVVGGVRRSALLSLSNLTDERMRRAKSGDWWVSNGQRALANNSVCYTEKPDIGIFMKEWLNLYDSKSGERGIFNRVAAQQHVERNGRRDPGFDFGTNPCSEIILRDRQFCNLTEVVVRASDTLESLKRKVRLATILGTVQATLTDFKYLSNKWRENTEEERLLGVSLTGIMDHPFFSGKQRGVPRADYHKDLIDDLERQGWEPLADALQELKEVAIETNRKWAKKLGINPSTAITCVKPSGTVSQLVDSASGIHPRYSKYYIRTVRADKKDPLAQFLVEQGVPYEDDVTKPDSTYVFSFPVKAPQGSVYRDDRSAIAQLDLWLIYSDHWCEHKPSITVYVKENEWLEVGAWVYKHFDRLSGISFLPHSEHSYRQAPYQEITEEQWKEMVAAFPKIDWAGFKEEIDTTTSSQELACVGGACEIL